MSTRPPGPQCAAAAKVIGESLAGTAATARSWLCVEQPGPWGRDALLASHLDPGVAAALAELINGTGIRIVLLRTPGSHPDRHRPVPRRVYLAHTSPGGTRLEQVTVADPKELLDLDVERLAAGEPGVLGRPRTAPLLLMCTNGRRDVCCALYGRPVAAALAAEYGETIWECTHLGGHRFAPTGLLLPTGYSYGWMSADTARRAISEAPLVVTDGCRGRSTWSPAGQVAELAVRELTGDVHPDAFSVTEPAIQPATDLPAPVRVSHLDGRQWTVQVAQRVRPDARPASCGAAPSPAAELVASTVVQDSPARR